MHPANAECGMRNAEFQKPLPRSALPAPHSDHPLERLGRTGCWFCPACQRGQAEPVEDHTGAGQLCPECRHPLDWFRPWLLAPDPESSTLTANSYPPSQP